MIFGNMKHTKTYEGLPDCIAKCFAYVKENALEEREKGSYSIDGESLYVNLVEYETCGREARFWEAHRQYIDVHVLLRGRERIEVNFIENMEQKPFVEKDDFLELLGSPQGYADLVNPGDFLICYPEDAHRTAVKIGEPEKIKKAIFKVRVP